MRPARVTRREFLATSALAGAGMLAAPGRLSAARAGGGWAGLMVSVLGDGVFGVLAGAAVVLVIGLLRKVWPARSAAESA